MLAHDCGTPIRQIAVVFGVFELEKKVSSESEFVDVNSSSDVSLSAQLIEAELFEA